MMNQISQERISTPHSSWLVRALANIVSILFHPLFIPTYICFFLVYVHPFAFAGASDLYKKIKLASIFTSTAFFPAFTVFMLRRLDFVSSIHLRTQKDRIIPIVASMVFYFWIFYVTKNQGGNPSELIQMLCATFVSTIIALTANNFMKISLHAIAMGVLVGFFVHLAWVSFIPMGLPMMVAILVAGLVGSARLALGEHTAKELVTGFVTGLVSMAISVWVVG